MHGICRKANLYTVQKRLDPSPATLKHTSLSRSFNQKVRICFSWAFYRNSWEWKADRSRLSRHETILETSGHWSNHIKIAQKWWQYARMFPILSDSLQLYYFLLCWIHITDVVLLQSFRPIGCQDFILYAMLSEELGGCLILMTPGANCMVDLVACNFTRWFPSKWILGRG